MALELGSAGGYLRTFVNEGAPLATLLRHASARIGHRDYVKTILAEIAGAPTGPSLRPADMPDALSERELEVLRLVAVGLSNRDIGQRLFISEKTVKTHLTNIIAASSASATAPRPSNRPATWGCCEMLRPDRSRSAGWSYWTWWRPFSRRRLRP